MDLDKIVNSIYDIEKDCKCDDCKKAIKNRKWLKRKFEQYAQEQVKNLTIPDVVGQSEQLKCEDCGTELPKGMKHKCYDCYNEIYFP